MASDVRPSVVSYMEALAASLPDPEAVANPSNCTYRKVSSLVRAAGNKAISPKLRAELKTAAEDAGLHTDVPLDDPTLSPDRRVRFSRSPFIDPGLLAPTEKSLRNWVLSQVGRPGPLAHCYNPRVEYRIPGKRRFVDLLLNERGQGGRWTGLVAVEFELTSPKGTVGQLLEYLRLLKASDLAKDKGLRGLIISAVPYPDEAAHLARRQAFPIEWWVVDARLQRVAASPS